MSLIFHRRQKMFKYGASAPSFVEYMREPDGKAVEKLVPSNKPLPSVATTDLKSLVRAGVPLEQVNTRVCHRDAFNAFQSVVQDDINNEFENPNLGE